MVKYSISHSFGDIVGFLGAAYPKQNLYLNKIIVMMHIRDAINPNMLTLTKTLSSFRKPYKSQLTIDKNAIQNPSKETLEAFFEEMILYV